MYIILYQFMLTFFSFDGTVFKCVELQQITVPLTQLNIKIYYTILV